MQSHFSKGIVSNKSTNLEKDIIQTNEQQNIILLLRIFNISRKTDLSMTTYLEITPTLVVISDLVFDNCLVRSIVVS